MANAYAAGSKTFTIDTDTNVAGLTTLKGSAPASDDIIVIMQNATTFKAATLTLEQDMAIMDLGVGYTTSSRTTHQQANLVVNDGVTLTLTAGSNRLQSGNGTTINFNGTLHTIGTSNGNADQTFGQHNGKANHQAVWVDNEPWRQVLNLTGERVQCGTTNNSSTLQCASDPRYVGLALGNVIEIRKRSDGTLVGTRTITSFSATAIGISGGAITTDSSHSVYLAHGATDKVYMISGGNIVFGDGNASAWNNNGGAIPPNGAAIQQCGILVQSSSTSQAEIKVTGMNATGTEFAYTGVTTSLTNSAAQNAMPSQTYEKCGFHHAVGHGWYLATGKDVTFNHCIFSQNAGYGLYVTTCIGFTQFHGCMSTLNQSGGYYVAICDNFSIDNCTAWGNYGYGIYIYGCKEATGHDLTLYYAGSQYPFYVGYQSDDSVFWNLDVQYNAAGIAAAYGTKGVIIANSTSMYNYSNSLYMLNASVKFLACRSYGNLYSTAAYNYPYGQQPNGSYYQDGFMYRSAATGDAASIIQMFCAIPPANAGWTYKQNDYGVTLKVKDEWVYSNPLWLPGIASFGTWAVAAQAYESSTCAREYRYSRDMGRTWSEWATLSLGSTIIDATPDPWGEMIQFRISKSDSGSGVYFHGNLSATGCTFVTNYTFPASEVVRPMGRSEV